MRPVLRRGVVGLALVLSTALLSACDTEAQFAPSLPWVVGLQVDGETLQILTGTPCADVTRINANFTGGGDVQSARAIIAAESPSTIEQLSVGADLVVTGFAPIESLPPDFDWRDYSELSVGFDGPDGAVGVATVDLEPVKAQGEQHAGDGTAYVRDEGWLTPQEVTAGNTESFLTACTPDPEREQ